MAGKTILALGYHAQADQAAVGMGSIQVVTQKIEYEYTFENFFHPFVEELTEALNRDAIPGMLSPELHASLRKNFFESLYKPQQTNTLKVKSFPKEIDTRLGGPYANYNWELLFHIPLTVAVHLSKNQRFAEAQQWFHLIFDPTETNASLPAPQRFWKFIAFREAGQAKPIDALLSLLSKPAGESTAAELEEKAAILNGVEAMRNKPFQPYAVARTRQISFMMHVVMKYLDNLISWGDHLFQRDTRESITEAMQIYVLASNLLGEKPVQVPGTGTVRPRTFAQLRAQGLDAMGNALVDLEGAFPFNLSQPGGAPGGGSDAPLFGIGRTLYFCVPKNEKLLGYWDTVADRLFKIRNCMNIEGMVRPLALIDPPIDPGMLTKAVGAGLDIGAIVSGLNQPVSPVRSRVLIQKALEICGELRSLGNSLLSALEKQDAEALGRLRQGHEVVLSKLQLDLKYLNWKQAEESTQSLLTNRKTALERLHYYQRLLGLPADAEAPEDLTLTRSTLTPDSFDSAYEALVERYDRQLTRLQAPTRALEGAGDAEVQSGRIGEGTLFLTEKESEELNVHLPRSRDLTVARSAFHTLASVLTPIPDPKLDLHYWGLGGTIDFKLGTVLSSVARLTGDLLGIGAEWHRDQAGIVARTASYERRADEWILQHNLAAHDVMQIGRQILTSLIAEQAMRRDYLNTQEAITKSQETDDFLRDKFTNGELYGWMQGELSRLYYEYYRFAFDTARRAEQTMKMEIMRPELDQKTFIQFNYWDGGRKGLLSGEALHLDIKRMDIAYHDHNRREYTLTRHVSLLQTDPLALIELRMTGRCTLQISEALFDLDAPGHYFRRVRTVGLSMPNVAGPYVGPHVKLVHLKSCLRTRPDLGGGYARSGPEDSRFADILGNSEAHVYSDARGEEAGAEHPDNAERYLPFENVGAVGEWRIELPADPSNDDPMQFDYNTISDVVLHIRYTARDGGQPLKDAAMAELKAAIAAARDAGTSRLLSLRHEFPVEWARFRGSAPPTGERHTLAITLTPEHYPHWTKGRLNALVRADLFVRSSLPAAPATLAVSDRADTTDAGTVQDTLTRRPERNDLLIGQIANVPLPGTPLASGLTPTFGTLGFGRR
jgi:hypothetical protein